MEAKRQRRREGRDAGRRRAPILSEAEFLARREAVTRRMIIRQRDDLTQIAVLEDDILVEHYVDRESATSLIGNVYLARVQNVLPSMEAAFVDIGRGRNAVIYAGEVDWDSFGAQGQNRKVEKVLKSGQTILVQVTKDPVGAKGARLTNHVSIPGRYIVYAPERAPVRHLPQAARERAQAAQGHPLRPGRRGERHRPHRGRGRQRGGAGPRRQPAQGAVVRHRGEGRQGSVAPAALRRAGPDRPDRARPLHGGLLRADRVRATRARRRVRRHRRATCSTSRRTWPTG